MQLRSAGFDEMARFHALAGDAFAADYVGWPVEPLTALLADLVGDTSGRAGFWLAVAGGTEVGLFRLYVPSIDNTGSARLNLTVMPAHRGVGHGRRLLSLAFVEAAQLGRRHVVTQSSSVAGARLARSVGAEITKVDVRRLLDLHQQATELAAPLADSRIVQWSDRAPDHLLEGLAAAMSRMSTDAPHGSLSVEAERWTPARYRALEQYLQDSGRTQLVTCAVDDTGKVMAMTDMSLHRTRPAYVLQRVTLVMPESRGRGLALLIKQHNLERLRNLWPAARWVNTLNADMNGPMIAVNDRLGFRVVEERTEWQIHLHGRSPVSKPTTPAM